MLVARPTAATVAPSLAPSEPPSPVVRTAWHVARARGPACLPRPGPWGTGISDITEWIYTLYYNWRRNALGIAE